MKRVQCISNVHLEDAKRMGITALVPKKDEIFDIDGEYFTDNLNCLPGVYYVISKYPAAKGYHSSNYRELASDEELEAYKDKVEGLQFKEITALEIIYQKVEV